MSIASDEFASDPDAPVECRVSKRFTFLSLVGGGIALLLGLALEWDLYPRLASLIPDVPIPVLNGWWLAVFGAIFFGIGVHALIVEPVLLRLDSEGLHSPAQRLSVPWNQILGVRELLTGGGGGYLIVRLADKDAVPSARGSRRRHYPIRKLLTDDEVPISVTGGTISLETATSLVESRLAKLQPQPPSESCAEVDADVEGR